MHAQPLTEDENELRAALPNPKWAISIMIVIFVVLFSAVMIILSVLFIYFALCPRTGKEERSVKRAKRHAE